MTQKSVFLFIVLIFSTITLPIQADYQRYRINLIENGGFECTEPEGESVGAYWLTRGRGNLPEVPRDLITNLDSSEGQYCLVVSQGDSVWQYLPGVQEYADSLTIRGAVKLTGNSPSARLHLTSADGKSVVYIFGENPNPPQNDSLHVFTQEEYKCDEPRKSNI